MAVVAKEDVSQLELPKGFRFHPTDEELVMHYLCPKAESQPLSIQIIADVDIYKFDPWNLPEKAVHGENEWYFFSPRDRKYPNGSRPNRAARSGYWKATGTDKHISCIVDNVDGSPQKLTKLGVKKALVFYKGRPPNGVKTNWIMHEYRLADSGRAASVKSPPLRRVHRKGPLRLDDWVLCRIYEKKSRSRGTSMSNEKLLEPELEEEKEDSVPEENVIESSIVEDFLAYLPEIESCKVNQLQLPHLEEHVGSIRWSSRMDQDLQSTGSVVLDRYPSDDYEDDYLA